MKVKSNRSVYQANVKTLFFPWNNKKKKKNENIMFVNK